MSVTVTQDNPISVREELAKIRPPDQNPNFASIRVQGNLVIESGSNGDGNWIKYEDGTMVQWGYVADPITITTATGNIFADSGSNQTFPIVFIGDRPVVYVAPRAVATVWARAVYHEFGSSTDNTKIAAQFLTSLSGSTIDGWHWTALGKWR